MSFTRASESLRISQPAVSMQIRDLEVYLGTELFERHGRLLALTPAGERFKIRAARLINDLAIARDEALELTGQAGGHLRVGATDTLGNYHLPQLMGTFLSESPHLRTSVQIADESQLSRLLVEGSLDACFWEGNVPDRLRATVDCLHLGEDRIVLLVGKKHPLFETSAITLRELTDTSVVLRMPDASIRQHVERALNIAGFPPESLDLQLEISQTEALKRVLISMPILGFASRLAIKDELRTGTLREIALPEVDLARQLWLLTPADGPKPLRVRIFRAFVEAASQKQGPLSP